MKRIVIELKRFFIIPKTSERIFKMLNTKNTDYNSIKNFGGLETGIKLNKSEILFNRIEN